MYMPPFQHMDIKGNASIASQCGSSTKQAVLISQAVLPCITFLRRPGCQIEAFALGRVQTAD